MATGTLLLTASLLLAAPAPLPKREPPVSSYPVGLWLIHRPARPDLDEVIHLHPDGSFFSKTVEDGEEYRGHWYVAEADSELSLRTTRIHKLFYGTRRLRWNPELGAWRGTWNGFWFMKRTRR